MRNSNLLLRLAVVLLGIRLLYVTHQFGKYVEHVNRELKVIDKEIAERALIQEQLDELSRVTLDVCLGRNMGGANGL